MKLSRNQIDLILYSLEQQQIEFNDEAKNWFDRVKVNNDAFGDAKAGFTKGKQDFIDKERELGRSID